MKVFSVEIIEDIFGDFEKRIFSGVYPQKRQALNALREQLKLLLPNDVEVTYNKYGGLYTSVRIKNRPAIEYRVYFHETVFYHEPICEDEKQTI